MTTQQAHGWLVKSEPDVYSYEQLEKDGRTEWTGIRNHQAKNHLRQMRPGDLALFYHTGDVKAVVGIARVSSEPGPDSTAPGEDWTSVELVPLSKLKRPVTLQQLKEEPRLKDLPLLRQGRLSVVPVDPKQMDAILELGETRVKRR